MTQTFNGRRPIRRPGDKPGNSNLALTEVPAETETSAEIQENTQSETKQLTPAQFRQQRAESQPEKPKLVSYRGFSMQDGNVREDVLMLSPDVLLPNPFEAKMRGPIELQRAHETIEALAHEMKKGGFEGSLKARPLPNQAADEQPQKYELVYGHLRVEAAKRAGIKHIKVGVETLTDNQMLSRMFNENALRDDPGPVGDGETMLAIKNMEDLSVRDLAARIGKSSQWVQDRLDLARMDDKAKDIVRHNPKAFSLILKLARTELSHDTKKKYIMLLEKGTKPAAISELLRQEMANSAAPAAFAITDDEYDPDLPLTDAPAAAITESSRNGIKVSAQPVKASPPTLADKEAAILKQMAGIIHNLEQISQKILSTDFLEQAHTEILRMNRIIERARKK